ncbi:MAG: hypothetical protein FJ306_05560 [Planctomycetes bacterium]|nr:hypothetical protein [Planctomycetota bacterium]
MWTWIATAWLAAAGVALYAHGRLRRRGFAMDPDDAAFLMRFENELDRCHRDVGFLGMLPDRVACLLCVDGQETVVSLHGLRPFAEAPGDEFTRRVASLLGEVRDVGLHRVEGIGADFATACGNLLPQVRTRAWLDEHGAFGDSGLVHRALAEGLVVVYVLDDGPDMVFVCRRHLQRWRRSEPDLYQIACANLAATGAPLPAALPAEGLVLRSGDGFDAARVLLLLDAATELVVGLPDRDTLFVGDPLRVDVARIEAAVAAVAANAPHPVTDALYRLNGGRLQPVAADR